jgi:hypothetical protein
MASDLYRKRSEQMVANRAAYPKADSSIKVVPVTHHTVSAEYISKATLTHTVAMEHIGNMKPDEKADWGSRDINGSAMSIGEARLIFRIRHGNRVALNGFDGPYYDKRFTIQALHTMDHMLTKYPDVQLDEFSTKPPNNFSDVSTLAHAGRKPGKAICEINEYYLNFPDKLEEAEQQGRNVEWSHPDRAQTGDFGIMGATVVHEFGHLLDYTAYEGQWALEYPMMNSAEDLAEANRLVDKITELTKEISDWQNEMDRISAEILAKGPSYTRTDVLNNPAYIDAVTMRDNKRKAALVYMDLLTNLPDKYTKEKYPTTNVGRNGSVRKAIERSFNRHVGRKESAPIGPNQEPQLWKDFIEWTTRESSQYSVKSHRKMRDQRTRKDKETGPLTYVPHGDTGNLISKRATYEWATGEAWWNYTELVAESFADAEMNGPLAKPMSREIHAQLVWQLEQANGGIKAAFQRKKGKK